MKKALLKTLLDGVRPVRYAVERWAYEREGKGHGIEEYRDRFKGRAMLVVGNGPSLNETPLDDFETVPSVAMNKIDLIYTRTNWRPILVVCSNALVVRQQQERFADSTCPVFVNWASRWYMKKRNRERLSYYYTANTSEFSLDVRKWVGMADTVTYIALQWAYYMGADPVVLFGIDHSFQAKGPAHAAVRATGPDADHFDAEYFSRGQYWQLPDLEASEAGYRRAKAAFESDGRTIYDATVGGQLQVFEKITLEEARRHCGL